ncbi:MAG TPA: Uma2 family endonuclease [Pirellulales bacterium]|nr:Uma2 family endonuclease [Pirellulales bacterium]
MSAASDFTSDRSSRAWKDLLVDVLPPQGAWTEEQYLVFTDDTNRLIEFTDGCLEPLPTPTDRHQAILAFLYETFLGFVRPRGGRVRFAALRLRIRSGKFREPDLLLLLSADDPRRQNRYWTGADLALEVVSPDKPSRDLIEKRGDYAEGGVPEYWLVNPEDETVTVLRLADGAYVEAGTFRRGDSASSVLLAGFAIDVAAVFDAD